MNHDNTETFSRQRWRHHRSVAENRMVEDGLLLSQETTERTQQTLQQLLQPTQASIAPELLGPYQQALLTTYARKNIPENSSGFKSTANVESRRDYDLQMARRLSQAYFIQSRHDHFLSSPHSSPHVAPSGERTAPAGCPPLRPLNSLQLLSLTAAATLQQHGSSDPPTGTTSRKQSLPCHEDLLARTKQTMVRKRESKRDETKQLPSRTKKRKSTLQHSRTKNAFPLPPVSEEEERRSTSLQLRSLRQLWNKLDSNKEFFLRKMQQARVPLVRDTSITQRYSVQARPRQMSGAADQNAAKK